mmetsp:Transcript_33281/g.50949  ORF Transcript_33281/g.50949 Transcript_33281/m.50949 type:complete len:204 (+) Transcript_33281:99-710(+)
MASQTIPKVNLKRLHSHHYTKLLKDHKLQCGGRSKTRPDRDETTPQCQRALVTDDLHKTVESIIVKLRFDWLIHQARSDHIKWTHSTCHEESSSNSGQKLSSQVRLRKPGGLYNETLCLVVYSHLCSIQNHRTCDVGINTTIESTNPPVLVKINCCANNGRDYLSFTCHHFSLEHIKWISCKRSKSSCSTTSSKFLQEGRVFF